MLTQEGPPQSLLLFTVPPFCCGWLRIGIGLSFSMPVITRLLPKMVIKEKFFWDFFLLDLSVWVFFLMGFLLCVFVEFADLLHILSFLPKDVNFVNHTSYIGWKEYVNFLSSSSLLLLQTAYLDTKESSIFVRIGDTFQSFCSFLIKL